MDETKTQALNGLNKIKERYDHIKAELYKLLKEDDEIKNKINNHLREIEELENKYVDLIEKLAS